MVIIKRGGVNDALRCPVRGFLGVGCTPFFISTAEPSQATPRGWAGGRRSPAVAEPRIKSQKTNFYDSFHELRSNLS